MIHSVFAAKAEFLTCIPKLLDMGFCLVLMGQETNSSEKWKVKKLTETQAHTFLNFFCVLFNLFIFSLTALQQIIVEDFLYFASFIDIRKNVWRVFTF